MSETLKIFEPLKTYFAILYQSNCDDYSKCKELINILTTVDCSTEDRSELTDNFKNALSWFASELKKADSPIGVFTIKNRLKEIFKNVKVNESFTENVIAQVSNSINLNGFNMKESIGEDSNGKNTTYQNILESVFDESISDQSITAEEIFEKWFAQSFDTYAPAEKYFEDNIKDKLKSIDKLEMKLLEDFFEVKITGEKKPVSIEQYMKEMKQGARLNVKMENNEPKLLRLLPSNVINAFEEYMTSPNPRGEPIFYGEPGCYDDYKLKMSSSSKKEEYKVSYSKAVLDWFEAEARGVVNKGTKEDEVIDSEDKEQYSDSSGDFKFPGSFENVVNYKDNWRANLDGKLWKKNAEGKFVEYTDEQLLADEASFKSTDGNCGSLCIFSDPVECGKFFERMMKRDTYSMSELSDIINNKNFVTNYNQLKENIVKVNPLFIVGTLRMFGFDKYTELKDDGSKVVRMESFTRWWNRHKDKILGLTGTQHKNSPPFNPEPPANLELFFKLLILYINNNEFVLNPQTKQLTTTKSVSVKKIHPFKELKDSAGNYVPNPNYEKEMAIYEGRVSSSSSRPESLSNLVDIMRKNSQMGSRNVSMGQPENRLNLNTLLGLMVGITNGGHIRLGRLSQFATGKGYLYGGGDDMLPCSKNATDIYDMGVKALIKKGKSLSKSEQEEIKKELNHLNELEQLVYRKLDTMARYIKVINVMNDEAKNSDVTNDMMAKVVNEYESTTNKLATKSDSTISMLLKKLFDEKNTPKSFYSKLN